MNLDEDIVRKRFGDDAEILQTAAGVVHYLYPALGLHPVYLEAHRMTDVEQLDAAVAELADRRIHLRDGRIEQDESS